MKKVLVLVVFLLSLLTSAPLMASPLYGGYNGESESWIDVFYFGIDDQARWWVRIPVMIGNGLRMNFNYEYNSVISVEIVGVLIAQVGNLRLGRDTNGLTWTEVPQSPLSGSGEDSNGTSWSEENFLGYLGTGSDSNGNQWGFIGLSYQGLYPVKIGVNLSSLMSDPPVNNHFLAHTEQKSLLPPGRFFHEEGGKDLINVLTALSHDGELEKEVTTLITHSLDMESLLTFADERVFTPKRKEVIESMMNRLIKRRGVAQ